MIYRVRILRRALADLVEIRDFISQDAPETAGAFIEAILDRIEELSRFPRRGARPRDPRLRRLGYRFLTHQRRLIFYRVVGARVWILRVVHGYREYRDLL